MMISVMPNPRMLVTVSWMSMQVATTPHYCHSPTLHPSTKETRMVPRMKSRTHHEVATTNCSACRTADEDEQAEMEAGGAAVADDGELIGVYQPLESSSLDTCNHLGY